MGIHSFLLPNYLYQRSSVGRAAVLGTAHHGLNLSTSFLQHFLQFNSHGAECRLTLTRGNSF